MKRYQVTDEQWDKLKNYFECKKGRPYKNVRTTANGDVICLPVTARGIFFTNAFVNGKFKDFLKKFLMV